MSIEILKYYQEKIAVQADIIREQADDLEQMAQFLVDLLDPNCPPDHKNVIEAELRKRGEG